MCAKCSSFFGYDVNDEEERVSWDCYQLDRPAGLLEQLDGFLVMLALDGHAVDGEELVAAFEASDAISNATWWKKETLDLAWKAFLAFVLSRNP
jgi:hypothetical protein